MSRRKDPVDVVVAFFETAPLEQAQTVLTIARGILARRQPKARTAKHLKVSVATDQKTQSLDGAEAADDKTHWP